MKDKLLKPMKAVMVFGHGKKNEVSIPIIITIDMKRLVKNGKKK